MTLFSSAHSYLGVDLGSENIKVVELAAIEGRPQLVTYGYAEKAEDIVRDDSEKSKQKTIYLFKEVLKRAQVKTNKAIAAIPSYAVFTSIISLPFMPRKELTTAVQWEAKKFVPMPLEEMILDWKIIDEQLEGKQAKRSPEDESQEGKSKKEDLKILLTAASKSLVKRYVEIFQAMKLNLISLETEAFALQRSLVGNDRASIMIVDIGAAATDIAVVDNRIPVLNRSIDIGGTTITKAIANSLNIDFERAEQFKRDFGMMTSNNESSKVPKTIELVISSIVHEMRYTAELYQNQEGKVLEKIILTGGSAFLPNLNNYLTSQLKTKVYIGNPWARITYPVELKSILEELGPRLAVSVGLAMRELE